MVETIAILSYLIIFMIIIHKWNFFAIEGLKRRTLSAAFLLKVLCGFLLYAIYFYYYGNNRFDSDAFRYFDDSLILYETLKTDFKTFSAIFFGYGDPKLTHHITHQMNFWTKAYNHGLVNDNQTMIRLNLIFDLFSFGKYHVHTIFMCFLSFVGLTAMYKTFKSYFKETNSLLFIAVFLIPTVLFWGSGVLKEGVLLFVLGLFFLHFTKLTTTLNAKSLLIVSGTFLILLTLKIYVIVALIPGIITYLILNKWKPQKITRSFAAIQGVMLALLFIVPQLFLRYSFIQIITAKQRDFINVAKDAGSAFDITPLDGTILKLFTTIPEALTNALFRPFIWESSSMMLINSIENIILFGIMIVCIVFRKKLNFNEKNTIALLLSFSLYLFLIIGWTTPVAGALVRYKLPALPFLLTSCFILADKAKLYRKFTILNKIEQWL